METDESLENDKEARKWLEEIESFRSPPPPRKLLGSALIPAEKVACLSPKNSLNDQVTNIRDSRPTDANNSVKSVRATYGSDPSIIYAKTVTNETVKSHAAKTNSLDKTNIDQLRNVVKRESRPVIDAACPFKIETSRSGCQKSHSMTNVIDNTSNNGTYSIKDYWQIDEKSRQTNKSEYKKVPVPPAPPPCWNPVNLRLNSGSAQEAVHALDEKLSKCKMDDKLSINPNYPTVSVQNKSKSTHVNNFLPERTNFNIVKAPSTCTVSHKVQRPPPSFDKCANYGDAVIVNGVGGPRNGPIKAGWGKKTQLVVGSRAQQMQQDQFTKFEAEIEKQLESAQRGIGYCCECKEKILNPNEASQALGQLYHIACFTCFSCGRTLTGKKFYEAGGKTYCEEDYLFSGYQQSTERCAVCGHFIMDMILQAVNKSFHPACFRCSHCKASLDGVPFTMDDRGFVYCVADYHRLFAPKCAKCLHPITPLNGRDETVRVVAMQKDYHVDCYTCEGCGLQLTDEHDKRCYPMGDHLLCQRCHVNWSNNQLTSASCFDAPITDL